jgi:dehydrogenase/reductase SDR family member 12
MLQALRTAQFLALGYLNFTRRGFTARARGFNPADLDEDLSARSFLVTGANSGIGRAASVLLAQRGGHVHMLCRDPTRGEEARRIVAAQSPHPDRVRLWICDLENMHDIERFTREWYGEEHAGPAADRLQTNADPANHGKPPGNATPGKLLSRAFPAPGEHAATTTKTDMTSATMESPPSPPRLDCLINNAGAMVHERADSPNGLERNFAVNVMGTYVLTELLIPALERADHPRVITVSSGGMLLTGREALAPSTMLGDDLVGPAPTAPGAARTIDGQTQYARNKRCQVALTEHWATKYADRNIQWSVMHPGWTSTPGLARSMPDFHSQFSASLRSDMEGADTICWLAIAKSALMHQQAAFFLDRAEVPKHLWFAGTGYSTNDVDKFILELNRLAREKAQLSL